MGQDYEGYHHCKTWLKAGLLVIGVIGLVIQHPGLDFNPVFVIFLLLAQITTAPGAPSAGAEDSL